ncbi:MAG: DsbA family protein [Magnetococcales bacterium]|nr:DsbA family protein [Magnetococcales bacterium]
MIRSIMITLVALLVMSQPWTAQSEPVAKVGSWTLEKSAVDQELGQKLYELREEQIQEMVIDHLLELEAEANQIKPDEVLDKMVTDKLPPLSDEDVKAFIEANAERLPEGGVGMEDKIRTFLQSQIKQNLQSAYIQSLSEKYKVELLLTPPRYVVSGPQDLSRGKADAPITIIEFSDFECPYCRRAQESLKKVAEKYGDKVRFVFRHFPLPFHQKAPKASEAAQCAQDQGAFWAFHDALFEEGVELEVAEYKKLAKEQKLDLAKFNGCLDGGEHAPRIENDKKEGKKLGITGTPTFFVNGIKLVGAVPFSDFETIIDDELDK